MAFKEELEALMRLIPSFKSIIDKEKEDETSSDNYTESEEGSEKEDEQ